MPIAASPLPILSNTTHTATDQVKKLLALKQEYKDVTGEDVPGSKPSKKEKKKATKKPAAKKTKEKKAPAKAPAAAAAAAAAPKPAAAKAKAPAPPATLPPLRAAGAVSLTTKVAARRAAIAGKAAAGTSSLRAKVEARKAALGLGSSAAAAAPAAPAATAAATAATAKKGPKKKSAAAGQAGPAVAVPAGALVCTTTTATPAWCIQAVTVAAAVGGQQVAFVEADGKSVAVTLTVDGVVIRGSEAIVGYLLDAGGVSVALAMPVVQHWLGWRTRVASGGGVDAKAVGKVLEGGIKGSGFLAGSAATSADIVVAAWADGTGLSTTLPNAVQAWIKQIIGASSAGGSKPVATVPSTHGTWGTVGEKYYVTTAINYTNGDPHCGHAYEGITADIVGRYHKNYGRDTFFMTGTDEHGKKIADSAEAKGVKPIDICNLYSDKFKDLNKKLSVEPDFNIRTTMDAHKKAAQALWQKCSEKGDLYLSTYEGWYNVGEEEYVTDADAELLGYKDKAGKPLEKMKEESYFFRMSAYGDRLIKHIEENPKCIQPEKHRQLMLERLKGDPLRDLSCSRSNFKWGVPVPGDPKHVMYVWFDALSNYLTGIDVLGNGPQSKFWPAQVHIIGKDILWFHTVIWPCMLMSAELPLPKTVFGHGFVQDKTGAKMSKSIGNVVDPYDMLEKYPSDTIRYFLVKQGRYGQDIKFSESDLIAINNSDLTDTIGNLVHRATNLSKKFCNSKVPAVVCTDRPFDVAQMTTIADAHMANFELQEAAAVAVDGFRRLNEYFTVQEPWKVKGDENAEFRQRVVRTVLEGVYVCAHLIEPFMPNTGAALFEKLGTAKTAIKSLSTEFDNLKPGSDVSIGDILFARIDKEEMEAETARKKAAAAAAAPAAPEPGAGMDGPALEKAVAAQGLVVRKLKTDKADKADIKAAVAVLLGLKKRFEQVTGDAPGKAAPAAATAPGAGMDGPALEKAVAAQGLVVRKLKGDKADKADIKAAVAVLLGLKKQFEQVTGAAAPPGKVAPAAAGGAASTAGQAAAILEKVAAQGLVVRDLKAAKAEKDATIAAVQKLLAFKKEYKDLTGEDVPGPPKKQKKKK